MLRLYTLGDLRLDGGDGRTLSRRRKLLVLLAYLCRRAPRAVSRTELVDLFWGDHDEAKARQSLRQAVLQLKRHLGDALIVAAESVAVAADGVEVDVALFEQDESAGRDRDAIAHWAGDFLGGADEGTSASLSAWIDAERVGLHRRVAVVFERVIDESERRGDWRDAIAVAERWCELSPLDERAVTRLIGALRHGRRHGAAIAAHAAFTARLREGLDIEPSPAFIALAHSLEHQARETPANGISERAPMQFVGRESAFRALNSGWQRTERGAVQVAIVEARPGFGASRLCEEFARRVRDSQGDAQLLIASAERSASSAPAPYEFATTLFESLEEVPALGGVSPEALAALQIVVPGLAHRFPNLGEAPATTDADALRRALHEALSVVGEDGPVLVVADGFVRADEASRALIASIAGPEDIAAMLVVTATPYEVATDELLVQLQSSHASTHIRLDGFTLPDVSALFGQSTPLANAVWTDTAGVPSFVAAEVDELIAERVLRTSATGGLTALPIAVDRPLPTPSSIRGTVAGTRLSLGAAARASLDAIAVAGSAMSLDEVANAANQTHDVAEDAISELVRADLVRVHDDSRVAIQPPVVARVAAELASHTGTIRPRVRTTPTEAPSFEIIEEDLPSTESDDAAPTRRTLRRRVWLGAAAGIVALAIAAAPMIAHRRANADPLRTVAVLPFTVRGDPQIGFLRTGMVNMLSTSLDGAGGLRTVDPRAVLAASDTTNASGSLSPDVARGVASRIGATHYIAGDAVGANGSVEVEAALYSVDGNGTPIARAHANGSATELFGIVDRLSAQLAVSQGAASRGEGMRLGELTTSSVNALKLYLDAEALYRINDMPNALAMFERAAKEDTTFALAWYGMASAASWMLATKQEQFAAAQAEKTAGRLSERDRTLIKAFAAYSRGQADSAEHLASIVADAYNDVEAWVIIGETLYHHNWKRGRSVTESRRAWEHVLAADPRHWPALAHLSEVAGMEDKRAEADSLLRRYRDIVGAEHVLPPSTAFRVFNAGTQRERDSVVTHLAADHGFWLMASVWYVAVYSRDLVNARRLANLLVDPLRPPEEQGFGRVLLAHLDLASGRWREARAELAIAEAHTPIDAAEHEALLSLAPFITEQPGLRIDASDILRRLDATLIPAASSIPFPTPDAAEHPLLKAYVHGALAAQRNDTAATRAAIKELETTVDSNSSPGVKDRLRLSLAAELARSRGANDEALANLERAIGPTPFVIGWTSAFLSQARERYLRAELLRARGRDEEALRWYATFGQNSPYDLVYLGPALFHEGEILERRGRKHEAAERYARFIDLWKECDPELRPMRDDATRRLASLGTAANH